MINYEQQLMSAVTYASSRRFQSLEAALDTLLPLLTIGVGNRWDVTEGLFPEQQRASEIHDFIETCADGVAVFDREENLVLANNSFRQFFAAAGTNALLTRPFLEHRTPLNVLNQQGQRLQLVQRPLERVLGGEVLGGSHTLDLQFQLPNHHEVILNVNGTPMRGGQGQVDWALLVFRDVTSYRRIEQHRRQALNKLLSITNVLDADSVFLYASPGNSLSRKFVRQLELLAKLIVIFCERERLVFERAEVQKEAQLAIAQERGRVARELHDSVSQAFFAILVEAQWAEDGLEMNQEQRRDLLEHIVALAEMGLAEIQLLLFDLRPESLEREGMSSALLKEVAILRTRYRLVVEIELDEEPALSLESKHALYRIAQEALHNIVKHANASLVNLRLVSKEREVVLVIQDNGRGFDPGADFPGRQGLRSIRERVELLQGAVKVESFPGQGTTLTASLPRGGVAPSHSNFGKEMARIV